MNFKKIMSLFLAVLMLCGSMTGLSVITASAAEVAETTTAPEETTLINYLFTELYASPEEKLASMKLMTTKGNYAIYALENSGEVAVKDLTTGQILFTNPYDVGAATASDSVKNEIMSQIVVKFEENGREKDYTSFEYAAMRDQIKVKNIKNGIRVEYTIGREEARRLVPRMIEKSRFESLIQAPMEEYYGVTYADAQIFRYEKGHPLASASFYLCKQMSYFVYKSLDDCSSDRLKQDLLDAFPIVDKMDIYILDKAATTTEIEKIEEVIKTACPNYSYEEMDYDHQLTEYSGEEENPPVFKMALEYTLDADGFTVRLPANGIRYNESKFQLTNLSILPYMGAGNNAYSGYTFYPDGSGALFSFEDLADQNTYTVASKIYGVDYAYHQISGTYQQAVRYPVFGIVENTDYYDCIYMDEQTGEDVTTRLSGVVYDGVLKAQEDGLTSSPLIKKYGNLVNNSEAEKIQVKRGYVAIIEEGDALTELVTYHAGVLSPYDTVKMNFNPRPKDSYNVADSISVGSNSEWTVVSNRKYVGNYKIHYVMLTDENDAAQKKLPADSWYEASWLGMAKAYRDYLVGNGVLNTLSAEQTSGDIPLYIESFGATETIEKVMSIPVEVMRPLTSAQDVITMYEELSEAGATNINFKLTGYANGGVLYSTIPYRLKWEKAVGKDVSMQELFDYAAGLEEGELGLFPEFDFSYVVSTKAFDGFRLRKHAVRTIDDRVTFQRGYIATQQRHWGMLKLAISPAYFNHFYEKLMENYLQYDNVNGISVSTLGNALNSDFDEDEPYNREDSKGFVQKALEYISGANDNTLQVMVDGGNAFTWQYADHILGAALDSSRYIKASYSVPFIGVVLHGYKNFAGTPLNMEGDVNYAKLKAIENGASVYFTLSYQNTQVMKENEELSKYYSIRYDIWKDDVVEIYNELNRELKDVQNKIITDHQFLAGFRVPDSAELDRDITQEFESVLDFQINKTEYEEKQKSEAVADARDQIASVEVAAENFVKDYITFYSGISGAAYMFVTGDRSFERRLASYNEAKASYDAIMAEYEAADDEGKKALETVVVNAEALEKQALGQLRTYIRNVGRAIRTIETQYDALSKLHEDALNGAILIKNTEGCPASIIAEIELQLAATEKLMAETMGVKFEHTVDKAGVDTFLRTHISTLIFSCYGTSNQSTAGVVGKAENIYKMLAAKDYGLIMGELDLLRYLEANKELTDEQLIAKYGLKADKSSVDGLILYVKELLGDRYTFDPIIAGVQNGIEDNIRDYFEALLNSTVSGLGDNSVMPALNFDPYRTNDSGRLISNSSNISTVTNAIKKAIDEKLTAANGVFGQVVNGDYTLDKYFTEDQMNALIDECVEIIRKNTRSEENTAVAPEKSVQYLTPETMRTDLLNFIEGYYYTSVNAIMTEDTDGKLYVQTVSSKTDDSIEMLVELRVNAYGEVDPDNKYESYIKLMQNDTELQAILTGMNDSLKGAYGDVKAELDKAFFMSFVTTILGKDKAPTVDSATRFETVEDPEAEGGTKEVKISLKAEVGELVEDEIANVTLDNIDELIAKVEALHAAYELDEDYDVHKNSAQYVYYAYLKGVSLVADSFYYDPQMAQMDATVRAEVAEKNAAILAALPDGFTVYDLYNQVMNVLANPEDSVNDFAAEVAGKITHVAEGKYTVEEDVLAYYIYRLLNSFEGYDLSVVPTISIPANKNYKNAMTIVDDLLTKNKTNPLVPELINRARAAAKRGEMPNYALSSFLTAEEIDAYAYQLGEALGKAKFLNADSTDSEALDAEIKTLLPELKAYLQHAYFTAVLTRLNANKQPAFHVSEVYGSTLYEEAMGLKELMYFFTSDVSGMTYAEIDKIIGGVGSASGDTEEEDEASRYLSDDGRIVSVTYGDKNADGSYSAYKTFILNYNNFSVSVEYDEVTYTIPAYGYVVVMH